MQQAFDAYESVRHRLPAPRQGGAGRRVGTLDDIAEECDVFLLDAFGVLNIGETAIPGVPERVAGLQVAGKRVLVVTNAASYSHDALLAKYTRLGYRFDPADVISSRRALLHGLTSDTARRWGLMASPDLEQGDLAHLDLQFLADDPAHYDAVEGFLMVGSAGWSEARQALLEAALRRDPRPVLVGNPDIVAPQETGFTVEPGSYAHRLADATGIAPRFFGKPFANIYDLVFAHLGPQDRSRVVMVGDSLHTDILGGHAAGVRSALIAGYGLFAGHDVTGPIRQSGICPDYILERP